MYDNDMNISVIFSPNKDDSSDDSDFPIDIDEFEYNKDGHTIFPFQVRQPLTISNSHFALWT